MNCYSLLIVMNRSRMDPNWIRIFKYIYIWTELLGILKDSGPKRYLFLNLTISSSTFSFRSTYTLSLPVLVLVKAFLYPLAIKVLRRIYHVISFTVLPELMGFLSPSS